MAKWPAWGPSGKYLEWGATQRRFDANALHEQLDWLIERHIRGVNCFKAGCEECAALEGVKDRLTGRFYTRVYWLRWQKKKEAIE